MKKYTLSFSDSCRHIPEHPERTAYKSFGGSLSFDIMYQVWPSKAAMEKTIEMQEKRAFRSSDWRRWAGSNYASKLQHKYTGEGETCDFCGQPKENNTHA